ncbi:MAG: ankyrin repeat domain-containing protein [Terriglobales bacterium]
MEEMRRLGVARATVVLRKVVHYGGDTKPQVTDVLYFWEYDGPDPEILSPRHLQEIVASGLDKRLRELAIHRAAGYPDGPFSVDGPEVNLNGKTVETEVTFAGRPWLEPPAPGFFASEIARLPPLAAQAGREDLAGVLKLLNGAHYDTDKLNQALVFGAADAFDNRAVLRALVAAGADPNASAQNPGYSTRWILTPLIAAASGGSACNVENMLQLGALPSLRDNFGHTALDWARGMNDPGMVRRLTAAAKAASAPQIRPRR